MTKTRLMATATASVITMLMLGSEAMAWVNCSNPYQRLLPPCCPSPCPVQDNPHQRNEDQRQAQEQQRTQQNQQQNQTTQQQQQATGNPGPQNQQMPGAGSPLDSLATAHQFTQPTTLQGLYFGPGESTQSMTIGGERPSRFTDAAKNSSDALIDAHVFVFRAKRQIEADAREIAEMAQQLQANQNLRSDMAFANRVRAKIAQVTELRNALQSRLVEIKSKRRMFHLVSDQTPDTNMRPNGTGGANLLAGGSSTGQVWQRPSQTNTGPTPIQTADQNTTTPPTDPNAYRVANPSNPNMPDAERPTTPPTNIMTGGLMNPPLTGGLTGGPMTPPTTGGLTGGPMTPPTTGGTTGGPMTPPTTGGTTGGPMTPPTTGGTTGGPMTPPTTGGTTGGPMTPPTTGGTTGGPMTPPLTGGETGGPAPMPVLNQMQTALAGQSVNPVQSATAIASDYQQFSGDHIDRLRQIALRAQEPGNPYGTNAQSALAAANFMQTVR
jgi:hypothetical protein